MLTDKESEYNQNLLKKMEGKLRDAYSIGLISTLGVCVFTIVVADIHYSGKIKTIKNEFLNEKRNIFSSATPVEKYTDSIEGIKNMGLNRVKDTVSWSIPNDTFVKYNPGF